MPKHRATTAALVASLFVVMPAPAGATAPTLGSVGASVFVPCADYDGLSALGSPLQTIAGVPKAGAVVVRHVSGSPAPLTIDAASVGLPTASDQFGYATSTAYLNSTDGCTDVVVGAPEANGGAGRVILIPGNGSGLALDQAIVLDGAAAGVVAGDRLGAAVSTVKTDAGVLVAAGAPGHDVAGTADAGMIVTWFIPTGGTAGVIPAPGAPSALLQGVGGLAGHSDKGDGFGAVLAQPHQLGTSVLTVGVPNEDVGSTKDSGAVAQITFAGAGVASNTLIWPGSGAPGSKHKSDRFGAAVAAPRGVIQAIGIPGLKVGSASGAGGVVVRTPSGSYKTITQSTSNVPGKAEKGDALGTAVGYVFGVRGVEVSTIVVGAPGENGNATDDGTVLLIDNAEVSSLRYATQKASGLSSKGRFGQVVTVVGGDMAYDEDMRDILLIGAPGSKSSSAGKYLRAQSSGVSTWESGLYFATQA